MRYRVTSTIGLALVCAAPVIAQVPYPDRQVTTPVPRPQKPASPQSPAGEPKRPTAASAVVTPLRKTTAELTFTGRAGERPPASVDFTAIRKTTSELTFTGRTGEAPPPVVAFTSIRKTTDELAFVGASN